MRRIAVLFMIATLCLAPAAYGDQAVDSALISAVKEASLFKIQSSLTKVQELLAKGADVNAKDKEGWTDLMWAGG